MPKTIPEFEDLGGQVELTDKVLVWSDGKTKSATVEQLVGPTQVTVSSDAADLVTGVLDKDRVQGARYISVANEAARYALTTPSDVVMGDYVRQANINKVFKLIDTDYVGTVNASKAWCMVPSGIVSGLSTGAYYAYVDGALEQVYGVFPTSLRFVTGGVTDVSTWTITGSSTYAALSNAYLSNTSATSILVIDAVAATSIALNADNAPSLVTVTFGLTSADTVTISGIDSLTTVTLDNTATQSLAVESCASVEVINCNGTGLTSITLTDLPLLSELYVEASGLGSLHLSDLPALSYVLAADSASLTSIIIDNAALTQLECYACALTGLSVTSTWLTVLNCSSNPSLGVLPGLDVNYTSMATLYAAGCGFDTSAVDYILSALDANGIVSGIVDLSTNSAPSNPDGLASVTSLLGKGWTVTVDP